MIRTRRAALAQSGNRFSDEIMRQRVFNDAGNQVVIEEFLQGEEASILAVNAADAARNDDVVENLTSA